MGPGELRRVWKGQGGSRRSGRVREDPEGSRRLREGAGGAGRINEGIVGLVWVLMGQEGSGRVLGVWEEVTGSRRVWISMTNLHWYGRVHDGLGWYQSVW